jgi:hypothetical protein
MQTVRRLLIGVGAIALVAAVLTLASPRSAHALVAALVQVTNTTANPAVTLDAEHATRIPYESTAIGSFLGSNCGGGVVGCTFTWAPVPTGYRLVIENISATMVLGSGTPQPLGTLTTTDPLGVGTSVIFTGIYIAGIGPNNSVVNQTVKFYVDGGQSAVAVIEANYKTFIGQNAATITGYLENCAVTGCPPIHY